jgi:hypothetical protein
MCFKTDCNGVDWIKLAYDRNLMNTEINLLIMWNLRNISTNWEIMSLSRRNLSLRANLILCLYAYKSRDSISMRLAVQDRVDLQVSASFG